MDTSNMKVLLLGHRGMLGSMIKKFLTYKNIDIVTTEYRWPDLNFKEFIKNSDCKFLINCIASIPQKNNNLENFNEINFDLPKFIVENYNGFIIHPSSDSERFFEDRNVDKSDKAYCYILSKLNAFNLLANNKNSYIIRTSVIGPEISSNNCLWSWFEKNPNIDIFGYTNHMWSGITSLEFSKICFNIINFKFGERILDVSTEELSKFEILNILNRKLCLGKNVIPISSEGQNYNFFTKSLINVPDIESQIEELIRFNIQ